MKRRNYFDVMEGVMHLVILAVAVLALACSCEEHVEDLDYSQSRHLYVGNVLLDDNRIIHPSGYDSIQHHAIGIIFHVSRDTAWVVSTHELGRYAYADSLGTIASVSNNLDDLCGTENTAAMLVSEISTPAADAVAVLESPVSSWALPSVGELRELSSVLPIVKLSLGLVGGEDFSDGLYVSSTQDGASAESEQMYYQSVSLYNGFVTSTIKTTPGYVRPILRIHKLL